MVQPRLTGTDVLATFLRTLQMVKTAEISAGSEALYKSSLASGREMDGPRDFFFQNLFRSQIS